MTRRSLFAGVDRLDAAEADVALAKARLGETLGEIKDRLAPANLLDDAIDGVRTRSVDLAESASVVVRERPVAVAAGTIGVALLVVHRPILRLARKLFSRR